MSLGDNGSNERALGNPSTTGQGELSAIVVFRNTSALTVELTSVRHNVEIRRCNQNANLLESLFVWSRTGATLAEIQTMTTAIATAAVFPATVASTPGSRRPGRTLRRAQAIHRRFHRRLFRRPAHARRHHRRRRQPRRHCHRHRHRALVQHYSRRQ